MRKVTHNSISVSVSGAAGSGRCALSQHFLTVHPWFFVRMEIDSEHDVTKLMQHGLWNQRADGTAISCLCWNLRPSPGGNVVFTIAFWFKYVWKSILKEAPLIFRLMQLIPVVRSQVDRDYDTRQKNADLRYIFPCKISWNINFEKSEFQIFLKISKKKKEFFWKCWVFFNCCKFGKFRKKRNLKYFEKFRK